MIPCAVYHCMASCPVLFRHIVLGCVVVCSFVRYGETPLFLWYHSLIECCTILWYSCMFHCIVSCLCIFGTWCHYSMLQSSTRLQHSMCLCSIARHPLRWWYAIHVRRRTSVPSNIYCITMFCHVVLGDDVSCHGLVWCGMFNILHHIDWLRHGTQKW